MVAGTSLLGASGYAFLTLTAVRVSPADYAALASLYLLVALVGPALFFGVEQEITRLVAAAEASGVGARGQVLRLARLAGGIAAAATAGLLALYPVLVPRVFHGNAGLWFALTASVVGMAALCVLRGAFAGAGRLRHYALCVGLDGLVRLLPTALFALLGVRTDLPYGLALGLGPVAAFAVMVPFVSWGSPGPVSAWPVLVRATGWLVAAWGLSLVLANLAPVVVTALSPAAPALAGVFAFAFVLARVPVFVLLSLQALILPRLSAAVTRGDRAGLRVAIRRALLAVGGLGAVGLALTAPVASWLVGRLFPRSPGLSWAVLTGLALGTAFALLIQVLQPALIATTGHHRVALAWLVGAVVFAGCFLLPAPPVTVATLAQVLGCAATAGVMAGFVRSAFAESSVSSP